MKDQKLSFDDQIKWLKDHGLNIEDEAKAKYYLSTKSYFYKMISFVKNFNVSSSDPCINSFEALVDVSTLDMELRYDLLKVCLDIEHAIKTYILKLVTNDPNEDGYNIVQQVINNDKDPAGFKRKLFSSVAHYNSKGRFIVNSYYRKFYDKPPIWIIVEITSLVKLRSFVEYLSNRRPGNKKLQLIKESFKYINKLRNSCAHNRILINKESLVNKRYRIPHNIYSRLRSDDLSNQAIKTPLLLKIALALRVHKALCGQKSHKYKICDLHSWFVRSQRNIDLYHKNTFNLLFKNIHIISDIYI